jgi:hypothetical protein
LQVIYICGFDYSKQCSHDLLVKYYEVLECAVYETLAVMSVQEKNIPLKLLNIASASLAKVIKIKG